MSRGLGGLFDESRGYLTGWLQDGVRRSGVRVFRYHGLVEKKQDARLERNQHLLATFLEHVDYLRRFRIIGFDELMEASRQPAAEPAAMLTFDDGFANNRIVAEVLSRRRIPWSVFVPAGEIGERRAMWLVELSLLILEGDASRLECLGASWPLRTREERERAFRELRPRLKQVPAAAREEAVDGIRAQFPAGESERLVDAHPTLRIVSWPELQELSAAGAEIGSHGLHHEMHHDGQPPDVRERELSESRRILERRLGRPCRAFAYPNGDVVASSPSEAAAAGYALAFTTEAETVLPTTDRFLLPRLAAPGSLRSFVRSFWWHDAPDPSGGQAERAS